MKLSKPTPASVAHFEIGIVGLVCTFLVLFLWNSWYRIGHYPVGYLSKVYAQETDSGALTFSPETPDVDIGFRVISYKEARAAEICKMAQDKGYSADDCPLLVAHLYTENGAMAEGRHGDPIPGTTKHCSIGIIQWNLCSHKGMSVESWLAKNPEWADWRFQVNFYLDTIQSYIARYGDLDSAIAHWNWGGRPFYLAKVKGNLHAAAALLQ